MNFRSDTNYNVNRDSSKVTGLVSRSKSDIPSYYVLRSSRTEAYNVYSNILVLLDEFGYQNNKIYKKCFSRRKQILDRDITRNRSMYGKDIKFNREEVVVDSDSIEKEIDKMISLIKSGISLDDGNKRPFDYLDYYNKIGLNIGQNGAWGSSGSGLDCYSFVMWARSQNGLPDDALYSGKKYNTYDEVNNIRVGDYLLTPCSGTCKNPYKINEIA